MDYKTCGLHLGKTLVGGRLTRGMDPSVSVACGETPAAACERLPCETLRSAHMSCD